MDYYLHENDLKFKEKKHKSYYMANSYIRNHWDDYAARMRWCGTQLRFKEFSDGQVKLDNANFCRIRMCPLCSWRRSLKIYSQASKIMDHIIENNNYIFLFLTLTIKNVTGEELNKSIDDILAGYNKLFFIRKIQRSIKGSFRALEITHNTNIDSPAFNTYHPHLHCILAVDKTYLSGKDYISHEDWVRYWKDCISADYDPIVRIERLKIKDRDTNTIKMIETKEDMKKALCEVAKYTVKDSDVINDNLDLMDQAVFYLHNALAGRRLISFKGCFFKARKELNLDDIIDGDLIHVDGDQVRQDLDFIIKTYRWHVGFGNYILVNDENNEFCIG